MEFEQLVLLGLGATAVVIYLNRNATEKKYTGRYTVTEGQKGVGEWTEDLVEDYKEQFKEPLMDSYGRKGRIGWTYPRPPEIAQRLIKDCESGSLSACQNYHKFFGGTFTRAE